MRAWPWRRPRRHPGREDMDAALWAADRALRDARSLRCRADIVGEALRETGRLNHFGAAVTRAIRGA